MQRVKVKILVGFTGHDTQDNGVTAPVKFYKKDSIHELHPVFAKNVADKVEVLDAPKSIDPVVEDKSDAPVEENKSAVEVSEEEVAESKPKKWRGK